MMIGVRGDRHACGGGRCFKDGSGGLWLPPRGLGGCKTSIKRKWAKEEGEGRSQVEKEEMGGRNGEGKLIFKRVFSDTPQGANCQKAQFVDVKSNLLLTVGFKEIIQGLAKRLRQGCVNAAGKFRQEQ